MAQPSAMPLLLALGYGIILGRAVRRIRISKHETGDPPDEDLVEDTYGALILAGFAVGAYYVYKYSLGWLDQYAGPILAVLFESVPPVVGVILIVVGVIDHILEKEGFAG